MAVQTPADIVAAALELVEEVGADGLTMRDLADRMGMAVSAAYKHVPSKEALLHLAAAELYERIDLDDLDGDDDWVGRVRSLLVRVYDAMSGYRGMSPYLLLEPGDIAGLRVTAAMREVLSGAGFSPAQVDQTISTLYYYGAGALVGAADRIDPRGPMAASVRTSFCRGLDTLLHGVRHELEVRSR